MAEPQRIQMTFVEMKYKNGFLLDEEGNQKLDEAGEPRKWTLYIMTGEDKKKYTTFDTKYAKVGIPLEFGYMEVQKEFVNEKGETVKYMQRRIVRDAEQEPVSEEVPKPSPPVVEKPTVTPPSPPPHPVSAGLTKADSNLIFNLIEEAFNEQRIFLSSEFATLRGTIAKLIGDERITDGEIEKIEEVVK